jgi:hypothetical protein
VVPAAALAQGDQLSKETRELARHNLLMWIVEIKHGKKWTVAA